LPDSPSPANVLPISCCSPSPPCRHLLLAGLDYKTGSGDATKWLFFCSDSGDCPSGYSCMGGKAIKSPGGICAKITW
jgi:hypothetical protein